MRLNRFFIYSMCLAQAAAFTACGDDDPSGGNQGGSTVEATTVTVTPETLAVVATGGEYELTVTNDKGGWTAYPTDACSSWVSVKTPNWSSTGGKVVVTVTANTGTEPRAGVVVIKAGNQAKNVTITQDAPMQVDKKEIYSKSAGQENTVTVTGSGWTASSPEAWIVPEKVDDSTLRITTAQNDSDLDRTGTVEVKNATETIRITVKQSSKIDREINVPEGYTLVWNDEFNDGTTLSPSAWTHEVQRQGWVNNELQNYVDGSYDGTRVTEIKDGKLIITAFKAKDGKVYSGRVYANKNKGYTYGYFEARLKLPKGKGTWPAYWMMPVQFTGWPGCGEIDIMEEVGADPNQCSSSIHCQAYNHPNNTQKTAAKYIAGAQDEFHIYALEWSEDGIRTYIDGVQLFRFDNDKKGNHDTWPFTVPFYPIFNLAWGGDWGGYKGVDESALPARFEIDYIRIFQK